MPRTHTHTHYMHKPNLHTHAVSKDRQYTQAQLSLIALLEALWQSVRSMNKHVELNHVQTQSRNNSKNNNFYHNYKSSVKSRGCWLPYPT